MADANLHYFGLILLGNTGAGKSFLINSLLQEDCFGSRYSASSVTRLAASVKISLGESIVTVFDVPGLIEADQQAVEKNKKEIYKAFEQQPNCVIGFVFNVCGSGRLRDEDVVAFNAIKAVYNFAPRSLLLIVNGVSVNCPAKYHGEMTTRLAMHTGYRNPKVCFLQQIKRDSIEEKADLAKTLFASVVDCLPSKHKRRGSIRLLVDDITRLTSELEAQATQYESKIKDLKKEIAQQQRLHDDKIRQMQVEMRMAEARHNEALRQAKRDAKRREREYRADKVELQRQLEQAKNAKMAPAVYNYYRKQHKKKCVIS